VLGTRPGHLIELVRSPSPPSLDPDAERDEAALHGLALRITGQLGGARA